MIFRLVRVRLLYSPLRSCIRCIVLLMVKFYLPHQSEWKKDFFANVYGSRGRYNGQCRYYRYIANVVMLIRCEIFTGREEVLMALRPL